MHTQVGIVGAGPAGLLLSQILHVNDIDSVILERQDRAHVEGRIRAGVIEQGTVDLLNEVGVGERMTREGLVHDGIEIALNGRRQAINFRELTGKTVTIYGQTELTKDMNNIRLEADGKIYFEAGSVSVNNIDTNHPVIRYQHGGESKELHCDFIAGCDGFHGVCRQSFPPGVIKTYEKIYPFAWLGILAETPPPSPELIYARHQKGFALFSMRSKTISRNYLQCVPEENLDEWPDDRIWSELGIRMGDPDGEYLKPGPILEKSVTPMRSFVAEPMRHGRLFLAGDAAHIVPPTGAKGLNLAAADVRYLSKALIAFYKSGDQGLLDGYSDTALGRVWKAQRFSWWMTSLLHNFIEDRDFQNQVQDAELEYLLSSNAAMTSLAENYVGLPFD